MPSFRDLADFNRELVKLGEEIDRVERAKITEEQGRAMQAIAEGKFSSVLGGDPKFSGWKPTLDTKLKTTSTGATVLSPTRSSGGPITVAFTGRNRGNASGTFGPAMPRFTKSGKVRGRKAKRWNGYTDPKLSPESIRDPAEKAADAIAERRLRKATQRHFDVT